MLKYRATAKTIYDNIQFFGRWWGSTTKSLFSFQQYIVCALVMDTCKVCLGILLEYCPSAFLLGIGSHIEFVSHTFIFSLRFGYNDRRPINPKRGRWRRRRCDRIDGNGMKVCTAEWLWIKHSFPFFYTSFLLLLPSALFLFFWSERKPQYVFSECFCLVLFGYFIRPLIFYVYLGGFMRQQTNHKTTRFDIY